jgi:hypothetical protein
MFRITRKALSVLPDPEFKTWPTNLAKPDVEITPELLAKKYRNLAPTLKPAMFNSIGSVEQNWKQLMKFEKDQQFYWQKQLEGGGVAGFESDLIQKTTKPLAILGLVLLLVIMPIYIYLMAFGKSEFQQKHKLFADTPFVKRGSPYVAAPWDAIKKKEDGHYYFKGERLD